MRYQGAGICYYKSGIVFQGTYLHDKMTGQGTLKFVDGKFFEGQLQNSLFHGKGTINYTNGGSLTENFVDGKSVS